MAGYRFPTTPLARLAHLTGLGGLPRPLDTAPGEVVGDRIYRFRHTRCDLAALPPSMALVQPLEAQGMAPAGATARPTFWRTLDGKECVKVPVAAGSDLYGTGEIAGRLRRNGKRTVAWNSDKPGYTDKNPALYQSHPWVFAVRPDGSAVGVLADTTWRCEIDLTDGIVFRAHGPAFPVVIIERDTPEELVRALAELTGKIDMPPRWALGYHQCRFSYEPDAQVREIAGEFRKRSIPCDVIWMDIDYMDRYRIFTFDPQKFPDPKGLNEHLHAHGFKAVWMIDPAPAAEPGYFVYDEGTKRDFWTRTASGEVFTGPVWPPKCVFPDFTRAEVCDWWAGLYKDFMATGVDGVWNDMNEPAIVIDGKEDDHTLPISCVHKGGEHGLPAGPHAQYHNLYGYLMVQASKRGIAAANPHKRPFVLTRANYIGGQRFAATWTGDNSATWGDVDWTIPMVLNMGLSGQPFVGPDIGGFIKAGTPEMMARWWGFASMLPFCRGHAAKDNIQKEPWVFGEKVEASIRRSLERRYRLLPYLYTLFWRAATDGTPIARPLFFADPTDRALRDEDRAFLLGPDLVVAAQTIETPTHEHALPDGFSRSVEPVPGPRDPAQCTLRLRDGAILPLGPVMQFSDEKPVDPLTLVVSLDADGRASGELYEDAGEGFGHLSGDYTLSRFEARTVGDAVEVTMQVVAGHRPPMDRRIVVEVLTDRGVRTAEGRWGGMIRVELASGSLVSGGA